MADPEPPQPIPFPIRIVQDPPMAADIAVGGEAALAADSKKKSDYFYPAWQKFLAIEPARAKSTSAIVRKTVKEAKQVAEAGGEGLQIEENASTSYEQAARECKAKVAAIVKECERLNQKYRDAIFDLEASQWCLSNLNGQYPTAVGMIDTPPWIKRVEDIFDDPQFFIDGASANDVHQGSSGDCWFLAALMAISAKKELVERLCVARNEKAGVYGFVFYRDGEWIHEVIDDKLFLRVGDDDDLNVVRDWDKDNKGGMGLRHDEDKLKTSLQRGGEALYFSHCKSNETWLPLIEKAYAKAHGDYCAIEGGFPSEAIEDLTGGVGVTLNPEDIMDKDRFWKEQLSQVNVKYLFGGCSKPTGGKGIMNNHAYAVLQAWEEGELKLLKLKNPWGNTEWEGDWSDGSKLWTPEMMTKLDHRFGDDGIFWMNLKDFMKHFPYINRVRLLDSDWQVAQQWTAVNVPWTVDYLDTKFQFTVEKKCPVVIVLSQPDDRYFHGLRGRFWFSLHFRVVKDGEEEKWIVRSLHNSGSDATITRSVSAELEDLEPGTYSVLVKVTATRNANLTIEEMIFSSAVARKEKLLHVGRRYDYAHTKGNLRGLEKANKQQSKQETRDRDLEGRRAAREHNQKVNERKRKRKKRVDDAVREKRKELVIKQREKAKAKKARAAEKQAMKAAEKEKEDAQSSASSEEKGKKTPSTEDDAEASKGDNASEGTESKDKASDDLSKGLSKLEIGSKAGPGSGRPSPVSPVNGAEKEDDSEYESPPEELDEVDDDDFAWDSDLDAPVPLEEEGFRLSDTGKDEIFADDPWNAMCVLGLRVYAKDAVAKVAVIKGNNSS